MFKFFSDKFNNLKQTISKTAENLVGNVVDAVENEEEFSEFVLDDMEDLLISADLGVNYASELVDKLRSQDKIKPSDVKNYLKDEFLKTLKEAGDNNLYYKDNELNIYFIAGVNGVGKTTTIGKLAARLKASGKSVVLGAADTFRAAAVDQLVVWSERAGVPIIKQEMGADPASVAYDTLKSAVAQNADVVLIDTAGRLHNKINLMNELTKIRNVMRKVVPDAPHEVLLVIDGSTGQNAYQQAKEFSKATDVTALAVTKLDGTAKGGVVIGIVDQFKIPVKFIGVGEKIEDLQIFDKRDFVASLFKK